MSELSDNAKRLAAILCGRFYEINDGVLSATGHPSYNSEQLLEIASAALELAGLKIEFEDKSGKSGRDREYKKLPNVMAISVFQCLPRKPMIYPIGIDPEEAIAYAAILLHAARTAREWASEGGES